MDFVVPNPSKKMKCWASQLGQLLMKKLLINQQI